MVVWKCKGSFTLRWQIESIFFLFSIYVQVWTPSSVAMIPNFFIAVTIWCGTHFMTPPKYWKVCRCRHSVHELSDDSGIYWSLSQSAMLSWCETKRRTRPTFTHGSGTVSCVQIGSMTELSSILLSRIVTQSTPVMLAVRTTSGPRGPSRPLSVNYQCKTEIAL